MTLALLLCSAIAIAQETRDESQQILLPAAMEVSGFKGLEGNRDGLRWGHINTAGEWVVDANFAYTGPFSDGLAPALDLREPGNEALWGFIDRNEKWVIPPRFEAVRGFVNGFALVVLPNNGGLRYIDASGRYLEIAPLQQDGSRPVAGELLSPDSVPAEKLIAAKFGDGVGYIDTTGKIAIAPQFEAARPFSDGLAAVRVGKQWGYIDPSGKMVIAPRFRGVEEFTGGFARVRAGSRIQELWNYIDKSGKTLCEQPFGSAAPFSEGLAAVLVKGLTTKYGYIDTSCTMVIEPQFYEAMPFSEGLAGVQERTRFGGGSWSFIDRSGKRVISGIPGDHLPWPFVNGLAQVEVSKGGRVFYLERDGGRIEPKPVGR